MCARIGGEWLHRRGEGTSDGQLDSPRTARGLRKSGAKAARSHGAPARCGHRPCVAHGHGGQAGGRRGAREGCMGDGSQEQARPSCAQQRHLRVPSSQSMLGCDHLVPLRTSLRLDSPSFRRSRGLNLGEIG